MVSQDHVIALSLGRKSETPSKRRKEGRKVGREGWREGGEKKRKEIEFRFKILRNFQNGNF